MTPEQLVRRYQQRYGRIRANTEREIGLIWDRLGGLTDSHAERAAVALAEQANLATLATVQLVEALVVATGRLAGEDIDPDLDPDDLTGPALRGVDPMEEWTRPVVTARVAISEGSDFDAAMALGRHRAQTLSLTDAVLAQRAAMTRSKVVGYRRVLTGKSCALCAAASTQRYHSDSLMPIHQHCDCGIAPIIGSADPGRVINADQLQQLKAQGPQYWNKRGFGIDEDGQIFARSDRSPLGSKVEGDDADWRQRRPVRVDIEDHGELGPVLTYAS